MTSALPVLTGRRSFKLLWLVKRHVEDANMVTRQKRCSNRYNVAIAVQMGMLSAQAFLPQAGMILTLMIFC